jgi:hypothetical protein
VIAYFANKKNASVHLVLFATLFYLCIMGSLNFFTAHKAYISLLPDCSSYLSAATILYTSGTADAIRPYGISSFISIPLWLGASEANNLICIWCMQFVLWLTQVAIIFKTISLFANNKMAFVLSLFWIFNVSNIIYSTLPLSETFAGFLLTCVAYFLCQYFFNEKLFVHLAIATLLLCLLVLVRPTFLYLGIACSITLCILCIRKLKFSSFGICIVGLLLILYQCYKMHKQYGNYTVSYIDKWAMITYIDVRAKQYANQTTFTEERQKIEDTIKSIKDNKSLSKMASADFKNQLQNNTFNFTKAYSISLLENSTKGCGLVNKIPFHTTSKEKLLDKGMYLLTMLQNIFYSFSILLVLPLLFYRKWKTKNIKINLPSVFLYLICLYTIVLSGFSFYQYDRFHIIIVPAVVILWGIYFSRITTVDAKLAPPTLEAS